MFSLRIILTIACVCTGIVLYYLEAYFTDRTNFVQLTALYSILFILSWYLIKKKENFLLLTVVSILFRLVFLLAIPNLSQDFNRFIWDGRLLLEGYNPYLHLPETLIEKGNMAIKQAAILSCEMGTLNAGHFTNYPPANQFNFLISALFARSSIIGSVVVLRLQIILADIGIIYFGKKILEKLQLPIHLIFLYVLNPLVIIELTGNLHFESVMLFFLLWSLNSLLNNQRRRATILFSLSVAIKLIPILFIPLFYQWFTKKNSERGVLKFLFFGVIVLLITINNR